MATAMLLGALAVTMIAGGIAAARAEGLSGRFATFAGSAGPVDHGAWAGFLERHLSRSQSGVRLVDYGGVSIADRRALEAYLDDLQAVQVTALTRPQAMAFWINLYNALTVKVVLDHYPVGSIRDIDISPGLFADGPWGKKLVRVEGAALSLDDIEHEILRPIWRDRRIHYAVNCASIGCPNLATTPYEAERLEQMLDAAAAAYINHPRGVTVRADGSLRLSRIYDWYDEDFGSEADIVDHLRRYARGRLAQALAQAPGISAYAYDWALNDARAAAGL